VISGFCEIGQNTFIGVNATLANNVSIGENNWVGIGVTITQSSGSNMLFNGEQSVPSKVPALRFFRVNE
jgi:carbonic anhydrase/acetyltransferase-like protein (isoleucine patch superfamily)